MSYSCRTSRGSSSHRYSGVTSEIKPGNSISQVQDPKIQTWRIKVEHNNYSDWSLHCSDASVSKDDDAKHLPGLSIPKSFLKELSDSEKEKLAYYPSAARLINDVK